MKGVESSGFVLIEIPGSINGIRFPCSEAGLNYLCAGYRMLFNRIDGPMRSMAAFLKSGRFADEIMTIEAGAPA